MSNARSVAGAAFVVLGLATSLAALSCGGTAGGGGLTPGDGPDGALGSDAASLADAIAADSHRFDSDGGTDANDVTSATPGDATFDAHPEAAGDEPAPATCVPGCPSRVQCGLYVDCAGNTMACGQPCGKGETCVSQGGAQTCQTTSTMCAGRCGDVAVDACGVVVACGGCAAGRDCVGNVCVPRAPTDAGHTCGTLTCSANGQSFCGTLTDGCGKTKACSCPAGEQCYSGLCAAPPPECGETDAGAARCGAVPNACGSGNVQCGACPGGLACVKNTCTACPAPSCNGATCGEATNACGQKTSCGSCAAGESCYQGSCCTPKTCGDVLDGGSATSCALVDLGCGLKTSCAPCGAEEVCLPDGNCCQPQTCADFPDAGCGSVDLGCGVQKACGSCNSSDECVNNTCVPCQAKTCADYGFMGCGLADGCGKKLDCCPLETTCQGGLCCPIGQVYYQGTCCQPQCDSTQPPGPQESCGQIVVCNNN